MDEASEKFGRADEYEAGFPLDKPASSIVSSIRNTFGGIPKFTRNTIGKLQKVAWTSATALKPAVLLNATRREVLNVLAGVVEIPEDTHPSARETYETKNQDKTDTLDLVFAAETAGKLEKFFFKYRLMNQNRIMMEGRLNPQNSHITRYFMKPFKTLKYTQENLHLFKLAVVANLGYKVDKAVPAPNSTGEKSTIEQVPAQNILALFDELIENEHVQDAVAAMNQGEAGVDALGDALLQIKLEFGGDMSILAAVTALTKYMPYHNNADKKSFESDISMEIDGITNGFAMTILQFPIFEDVEDSTTSTLEHRLNQTGSYFGVTRDETTHLVSGIFATGNKPDVYVDLQGEVIKNADALTALQYAIPDAVLTADDVTGPYAAAHLVKENALIALYPNIADARARDLVKTAFMVFLYGGGIKSITRGIATDIVTDLYVQLSTLQREYNNTPKSHRGPVIERIKAFENNLARLGAKPNRKIGKAIRLNNATDLVDDRELSFGDEALIKSIAEHIAPRFDAGLNSMLGGTADGRQAVTQAGEVMHAVFMAHYDVAYAARKKELGGRDLVPQEIDAMIRETEIAEGVKLVDMLPQYKGPLNEDGESVFVDLSKRITDREAGDKGSPDKVEYDYRKGNKNAQRTSKPTAKLFTAPGVAALIRTIINMDASLMSRSLNAHPEVLSLYDAFMGNPEDLMKISAKYGKAYVELGLRHSVMAETRAQMDKVIAQTEAMDQANGNRNLTKAITRFMAREAHIKSDNLVETYQDTVNTVHSVADQVAGKIGELKDRVETEKLTSSQLYMADTAAVDPNAAPSFNERERELSYQLDQAKQAVFFALDSISSLPPATRNLIEDVFTQKGATEALSTFRAVTPDNVSTYIRIAKSETGGARPKNTATRKALKDVAEMFPESKENNIPSAPRILASILGAEGNESLAAEFTEGREKLIDNVRAELDAYTHDLDFTESDRVEDAAIEALKEEMLSLDNLRRENPETTLNGDVTSTNIKSLFDRFKSLSRGYYTSSEAMDSHTSVLQSVVDTLAKGINETSNIKIEEEIIDGVTQGSFNVNRDKVRVSVSRQAPPSANGQSPQEVYTHEMLHAVTETVLKASPIIAKRINRIYQNTKKAIDKDGGHEIFLREIPEADRTAEDVMMAKAQYDYVFDNTKNEANRLSEFLAYSTTNKALVGYLQDLTQPTLGAALPTTGGRMGQLLDMVRIVLDAFTKLIGRGPKANTHMDMVAVLEQLMEIQNRNENVAVRLGNKIVTKSNEYDEKIRTILAKQGELLIASEPSGRIRTISNAVIGGVAIHMSSNATSAIVLRKAHTRMGATLMSIAGEMGDGVLTQPLIKNLLMVKNRSSKARQDTERDYLKWFDNIWTSLDPKEISVETQKALTRGILQTNLSSLLVAGYTPTQINNLLGSSQANKDARTSEMKALRAALKLGTRDRAIMYAADLGKFMATGRRSLENGHMNVTSIAQKELTEAYLEEHPDTLSKLDAYATLVAMNNVDVRKMTLVKQLSDAEFAENANKNGIIDILKYHAEFTKASRNELFDGNGMQTQAGWTVERVDNLHSLQTGTLAQIKDMKKGGFAEHYSLSTIKGVETFHDTLYVSRHMPEIRYVSGVLSNTGQHTKGTTLTEIFMKDPKFHKADGSPDYKAIKAEVRKVAAKQTSRAENLVPSEDNHLSPVRNDRGDIVDYRIIMDHATKDRLLQPDTEFRNVFAHMQSSFIDKKNSVITDKQTIEELVREQVTLLPSIPERFVDIMDANSPYRDQFLRLPQRTRKEMEQYMVDGKFMVRESIVNKVFGFEAWDLSKAKFFQKEGRDRSKWAARMGHHMLTSMVSYGVDRVVVATTSVIAGNLMSNVFNLLMQKIPPQYIMQKTWEGFQEYRRYQADVDKRRELTGKIRAYGLDQKTSPEGREAFALKTRIENNRIHRMSEAGLNSLIVEDLNEASTSGYMKRIDQVMQSDKVTKYTNNMAVNTLGNIAKTVFMTKSSAPYKLSKKVVSLSDFLARYVMIEHATEVKGQSFDTAMFDAVDAFVLFDENLTPALDALSSVAGVVFASYFMRNHRAAKRLIKTSPTAVATSAGVQYATDIQTLANINSTIYMGNLLPSNLQLDDLAETIASTNIFSNLP